MLFRVWITDHDMGIAVRQSCLHHWHMLVGTKDHMPAEVVRQVCQCRLRHSPGSHREMKSNTSPRSRSTVPGGQWASTQRDRLKMGRGCAAALTRAM